MNALRLFAWHVLRNLAHHRALALLNILSVALGVAVYLATQIANHSANSAFAATVDTVAGKADLEIAAPNGNVPETLLPVLAKLPDIAAATPIVRGLVTLPEFPGEYLDVVGIDVFTNEPFRTFEVKGWGDEPAQLERWLRGPNEIAVSRQFAARHDLRVGSVLRAQVNAETHALRISSLFESSFAGDAHFAAMDIGWAQELFAMRGRLTTIALRVTPAVDLDRVMGRVRELLPPDATVRRPAQRNEQVAKMLGGFELNLTAMSLVSLLVGMFLIYNAISASVVRRRHEIGILRSLGTTRFEIRALFLGEAAALGAIGTLIGIAGGAWLASVLVHVVSGTISSLYVLISVDAAHIAPWHLAAAASLGMASVIFAAWLPANAAARITPVDALAGISPATPRRSPLVWTTAGALCLGVAALFSHMSLVTGPAWLGFGAAFFVLAGFSLVVPPVVDAFSVAASRAYRSVRFRTSAAIEGELAAANLARSSMRNSVTIASLAAAVAMTVGVSVMVFSFRRTVESWINQTLVADLFIAPASNEIVGPVSFIPPGAIAFLQNDTAVETVDTFRELDVSFRDSVATLAVVKGGERRRFDFVRGGSADEMRKFYNEGGVLVSESFARRYGVHDGDALELPTPSGAQRFPVAGVVYDYTRDQGVVYVSRETFVRLWRDDRVNSLAIYLKAGASADAVAQRFRDAFGHEGQFAIYSNRTLRDRVFEIFDRTFAVTYVLRTIAVVVALVGVFLSLTVLIIERSRELAVLRAIGGSARQIRRLLLWEAAFVGTLAAAIGIASGACLSVVLTGVINRAFFGWTIQLEFPWSALATTPAWIVAAAIIAAILPAIRASRADLAEALRAE